MTTPVTIVSPAAAPQLTRPTALRDKLAQLLMIRIGSNLPPITLVHQDEQRVAAELERCPVGGLLLFNGSWPETRDTLARLQAAAPTPMLVASDIERGTGQQVAGLTVFPHQRAFVDLDQAPAAIDTFCRITAAEAHAVGIHATFGPVADVNTDPRNPIIATRAFGDQPEIAAKLVASYVRSAEAAGLLTCAKHFPGHGDTHQDSHDAMPRVEVSTETLTARELAPFRAAIAAGVSMMMTAHVEYPALDASGAPATLSPTILIELLRNQLGFDGVVCSDSLLMSGVRERFANEGELAIAALNAGVDLLLDVADHVAVIDALSAAVDAGRVSTERVEQAFDRVWLLKERAFSERPLPASPLTSEQGNREAQQIALSATRTLDGDHRKVLPLPTGTSLTAVVLKPHHRPTDPQEQPLAAALRERFAAVRYFETGPQVNSALADDILAGVPEGESVVVAMIVKPAAWHAFGLSPDQDALIRRLLDSRPVVLACLGVENALERYPEAAVRLVTHSDVPASQLALAERLATATG
ncbi:glycoside hydrolase family 3 protein [Botrimarina hoheduenensis]|uniref:beta-N-acetylhexosaminidase n=1 Tax=Botrimarina hoheduenensis TaxID=2528000 RepID=A0A5C5VRL9_9BACT|nr:glycoside hydrolase family 3 N-terminal domain-containing protein [Botrimarina hoheduenensis]TWT40817.1 putative lipoprotein YbbD precursor [Botrimarina hoheduenensis]